MEMTPAYMAETAEFLRGEGYALSIDEQTYGAGAHAPKATCYTVQRGPALHLVLETVHDVDGGVRYFLEIVRYFGLRSYSFPLDSWKHFPDRVEFKFIPKDATGLGLSFTVDLADVPA